jgi:hypothetical protein
MSRGRIAIVGVVLVAFVIVVGVLVFANQPHGGAKVTINLTVTGAKSMTPDNPRAHQNDIVTINVKSDTSGEVHLHGYDLAFNTVAGQTVSNTFTADKTGSFEIEWEDTSTPLGTFTVTP